MPWSSQRASVGSLTGDKGKGEGGGSDDQEVAPDPHFRSREAGRFSQGRHGTSQCYAAR